MWYTLPSAPTAIDKSYQRMRHGCEMNDRLTRYGWIRHDGVSFGEQEIIDGELHMTTTFLKKNSDSVNGGDWVVRIDGRNVGSSPVTVSLLPYLGASENEVNEHTLKLHKTPYKGLPDEFVLDGRTEDLGAFTIVAKKVSGSHPTYSDESNLKKYKLAQLDKTHYWAGNMPSQDIWKIKDEVVQVMSAQHQKIVDEFNKGRTKGGNYQERGLMDFPELFVSLPNTATKPSNVAVFQYFLQTPFTVEIHFVSHSAHSEVKSVDKKYKDIIEPVSGSVFADKIFDLRQDFDNRFESIFQLKDKSYSHTHQHFARSTLSNLIGGIGYWHGEYILKKKQSSDEQWAGPSSLFSGNPCRPFFPRGFLWDEGFHQLLISQWNPFITFDVAKHWYNTMNEDGWIPREQILGAESRSKVPREYQAQVESFANPPTFLFVLSSFLQKMKESKTSVSQSSESRQLWTAESVDYEKFLKEVFPKAIKNYEWFKSKQNGPVKGTFRWRGRAVNHTLTSGLDDYPRLPNPSVNEAHVDLLSWMIASSKIIQEISQDIGGDSSRYAQDFQEFFDRLDSVHWNEVSKMYNDVDLSEEKTYVDHVGYISLFPILLGVVPKDSPKLEALLRAIKDPNQLWSQYGIRSISISDRFYTKGENYWTGPIWININYMLLSSLHKNYINSGPYKTLAKEVYRQLRTNLITNMYQVYEKTGYVWEQYHPETGAGQRCHPFTGWSSLIVLIMAEKYP